MSWKCHWEHKRTFTAPLGPVVGRDVERKTSTQEGLRKCSVFEKQPSFREQESVEIFRYEAEEDTEDFADDSLF